MTSQPSKVHNRLPSLNQLASRLSTTSVTGNEDDGASKDTSSLTTNPNAAPNRPRLAAFALRTTSSTGGAIPEVPVANDAAKEPSPAPNEDTTRSSTPEQAGDNDHPKKVGYKNIPSLDAITARLAKARQLSVDGSAKPPEPEPKMQLVEDPKTPGLMTKIPIPDHPLASTWTIFHDTKVKYPYTPAPAHPHAHDAAPPTPVDTTDYEAGLTVIGTFETVESFCRYFNWLKLPSQLPKNSNYHLFKKGIKPMWEDPANEHGGKWVLTMRNNAQLLDRCWSWLTMALVGQEIEEPGSEEVCGAVVSLRSKVDRIQLWTRSKDDITKLNVIGKKLAQLLDVSEADGIGLEFQYNTDDRPPPNKFISINAMPSTAVFGRFNPNGGTPVSAHPPANTSALSTSTDDSYNTTTRPGGKAMSGGVGLGGAAAAGGGGQGQGQTQGQGGQGAFGSFGIGIGGSAKETGGPGVWRKRA